MKKSNRTGKKTPRKASTKYNTAIYKNTRQIFTSDLSLKLSFVKNLTLLFSTSKALTENKCNYYSFFKKN